MTIATMTRMMKKIIKITAMTMFRFVIFWVEGGEGESRLRGGADVKGGEGERSF